jgi:hypothetical protein
MQVVVEDTCGNTRTFELNVDGHRSRQIAKTDVHEPAFGSYKRSARLELYEADASVDGLCLHTLNVYPTSRFRDQFNSIEKTKWKSLATFLVFCIAVVLLCLYDRQVSMNHAKTMRTALRTGALVESLFPENVRERMLNDTLAQATDEQKEPQKSKPIADFFPRCTLMCESFATERVFVTYLCPLIYQQSPILQGTFLPFAPVLGRCGVVSRCLRNRFTAWSSTRGTSNNNRN